MFVALTVCICIILISLFRLKFLLEIFKSFFSFLLQFPGSYIQKITDIKSVVINQTSVHISWTLIEDPKNDSNETFHIYLATNSTFKYVGSTQQLSYLLTNLVYNEVYSYKIGLTNTYTNSTYYSEVQYFIIDKNFGEISDEKDKLKVSGIVIIVMTFSLFLMGGVARLIFWIILTTRRKNRNKLNKVCETPDETEKFDPTNLQAENPLDCESASVFISESSFQDVNDIGSIETAEEINLTRSYREPDSICFANISNIEDSFIRKSEHEECENVILEQNEFNTTSTLRNVLDVEKGNDESERYFDNNLEVNKFDVEDEQASDNNDNAGAQTANDTYVIEQTESKQDLNETYEIPQKEYSDEGKNIEEEFFKLNSDTDHGLTDDNKLNQIILESKHFENYTINASYIQNKQFVATVHPSRKRNLLQLVYQTDCNMVVMLTTKSEYQAILSRTSDYVRYWPLKEAPNMGIPIPIELDSLIDQEISLQHSLENNSISFRHLISSGWEEDGSVSDMKSVLTLLKIISKHKKDNLNNPIIIHCNDGLSKTGVLLTFYLAMQEMEDFDIPKIVKNLRMQRTNMVPTLVSQDTSFIKAKLISIFTCFPPLDLLHELL